MREGSGDGIKSINGDHNHDEAREIESNNPEIAVINKKPAMQVIKENSFLELCRLQGFYALQHGINKGVINKVQKTVN